MRQVAQAAVFASVLVSGAFAEEPEVAVQEAEVESEAKRVRPPQPGAGRFITVQIDPDEQARFIAALPPFPKGNASSHNGDGYQWAGGPEANPNAATAYPWFWNLVSPSAAVASSSRLDMAISGLTNAAGPGRVPTPRSANLQRIVDKHGEHIIDATAGTRVSPALVLAVIGIESAGRVDAVSHAGASGLMQLMPATARRFGVTSIKDPRQNIKGGVAYLDWLINEFGGDPMLVLAGYNAGEGAVRKHGGVPPYRETRDYVPKVLAAWTVARNLCVVPPVRLTDGCTFAIRNAEVRQTAP